MSGQLRGSHAYQSMLKHPWWDSLSRGVGGGGDPGPQKLPGGWVPLGVSPATGAVACLLVVYAELL